MIPGPGFEWMDDTVDPQNAAKNVACIDTTIDKGTSLYNCHQNFIMGDCGKSQAAAGPFPMGSHGLCPHFYNKAFTNDFVPNNFYNCSSPRMLTNFSSDVKMGYMANFNRQ